MLTTFNGIMGKLKYTFLLARTYKNALQIVTKLIFKKPIFKVILWSGMIIGGGRRSLLLEITDEIFLKNVYTPKFLPIEAGDVVVDIGSNVGVFALFAANEGSGKIYAIEPLPENVREAKKNLRRNKVKNATVIAAAVSKTQGRGRFYLGEFDPHGLLFDHNSIRKLKKYINVKTETLEHIVDSYEIERIDFLKMDCEGSEFEILMGIRPPTWRKIRKISLEYHDRITDYSHIDLAKILRSHGYCVVVKEIDSILGYIYAWKVN